MKQITKRALSVILSLVMVLTAIPLGGIIAFAASSKSSSQVCSELGFWAPEAIYLYPNGSSWVDTTSTPFQYYINNNRDGSVKTAYDETGMIYINYPNAKNLKLSARFIDNGFYTLSGGSINLSTSTPSATADVTFSGTSPSLKADQNGCWIEWTLAYTDSTDGRDKKAYSYTYVYKPYVVPVGGFVKLCNTRYSNSYAQSITWISGVHSISVGTLHDNGGYYPNYGGGKGFSAFITKGTKSYYGNTQYIAGQSTALKNCTSLWSGCYEGAAAWNLAFMNGSTTAGPYFQTSSNNTGATSWGTTSSTAGFNVRSMDYWYKEKDAENILVNLTSGASGNITIDTSRYSNLKDIPNLAGGLMVTDDEASDEGGHWLVADASGITNGRDCDYWTGAGTVGNYLGYKNYAIARQGANSRTDWGNSGPSGSWEDEGVKYAGPWPRTLLGSTGTQGGTYKYTWMGWYGNNDDGTDFSFNRCTVDLNATYRSKAKLRAALEKFIKKMPALGVNGISSGTVTSCYFDANTTYKWTALQTAYKAAILVLGQINYTGNCDTLATNLTNALNALCTKVTLNANGGSISGTTSQYFTVGTNQTISVTPKNWSGYVAPTRKGYSFGGWATSSSATSGSDTVTVGLNNTLYAVWKPNTINVTYNANGATNSVLPQDAKFTYGSSFTTAAALNREYTVAFDYCGATGNNSVANVVTKYNWKGWKSNVNGTIYNANTTYNDNFGATSGTVTFTAQWESASLTLPSPTRTGYTFAGWYTASSGGTRIGSAGAPYTPTANTTLYAQWTVNKYALELNGSLDNVSRNDISGIGSADVYVGGTLQADDCKDYSSEWDYGTAYVIKDIKAAAGYTYDGASTISGTIGSVDNTVVLKFHTNTYTIAFNGNGSTGGSTASVTGVKWGADCQLTANGFTREGYDFAGWATSADGNVVYGNNAVVNTLSSTDKATVYLYAKWTPKTDRSYNVNVYVMNNVGAYPAVPETFTYGNQTTGSTVSASYSSYIPNGKDASQFFLDTSRSNVTSGTVLGNNGLTLVLYVARKSHTVTYDYATNGGTYATDTSLTVYYDGDVSFTPVAQKTDWTFLGWNTVAKDTTGKTIGALKMGTSDITLYAVYSCTMKVRCYYIDPMKSNSRTYQETSATVYNTADSITINTFEDVPEFTTNFNNTLSAFKGYTAVTTYTGSEDLIHAGGGVTFPSSAGFANNKLMGTYSGCYDMTVELTHDAAGGFLAGDNPSATVYLMATSSRFAYTTAKIPTMSAPERPGYTFLAWAKTPDAEQSKYIEEGKDVSLYYNTTVYAIWLKSWDENDEANRIEAETSADLVTGIKVNADGSTTAVTNGKVYKYSNYSDFTRVYNTYASALNAYNTNTGTYKFVAAKQLETALKDLRAYYSANLNDSKLNKADSSYINNFTVSYATGVSRVDNIASGRHTLEEMNLNHYPTQALENALQAKTEAASQSFDSVNAFEDINGRPAQLKINAIVEKMAKAFVSVGKTDTSASLTVYDSASAVNDILGGDVQAVNYVERDKDGATFYCYTNSKNPVILLDVDEIRGEGARACYPTSASVSGTGYEITAKIVENSAYKSYLENGIGSALTNEYYAKKAFVTLTPSFTTDNQTQTYTVKAWDDAYTGDSSKNYASVASLKGAVDTSFKDIGSTIKIVICYKSDNGFDVTGDTWENENTVLDSYNLQLSGISSSELAVYNDADYLVDDPQYGKSYYGSFVYVFKTGDDDSVENAVFKSADVEDVRSFFANSDNLDKAVAKGYENAPDSTGLGYIPWSRDTGRTLSFKPADNAYVYIHIVDKWGNSVDKVEQLGKFSYFAKESFNFIDTVVVTKIDGVNYVHGFKTSMSKSAFVSYYETENTHVEVELANSSRYIGTGSVIKVISDLTGKVIGEYVVIIYGDVDGNAKIDINDSIYLSEALTGDAEPLSGVATKLAANVYGTRATINDQDVDAIGSAASGELEIDQSTGKVL